MILATLKEKGLLREMMLEKDINGDLPIFVALAELARLEASILKGEQYITDSKAAARAMVRKLIDTAKELDIDTTEFRSGRNESFDGLLAKYDLLPKERRVSPRIFSEQVDLNLGELTILPRDVLVNIFQWLDLSEAVMLLTVSKKFFQVLTSKQIWAKELPIGNFGTKETFEPFSRLCAIERSKKLMAVPTNTDWFAEVIEVTNGEGNLSFEHEFIYGLKLHGKPIIASFPDNGGSIVRCILRCGSLTEEKKQYVAKLENILNNGIEALDLSTLLEDMTPFMNVLNNGRYLVSLKHKQRFLIYEYNTQTILPQFFSEYPSETLLLFTQPSDQLDRSRIEYYKSEIERGKRPIILLLQGCWEAYLIDGHHKMKAYMETNRTGDAIFISIDILSLQKRLSRAEELQYISVNHEALQAHKRAMRYHTYPEDPKKEGRY